jgi:hypothetical protein
LISGDGGSENVFWAGSYGKQGKLIRIDLESSDYEVIGYDPIDDLDDNFFTNIINSDSVLWLVGGFNVYTYDHNLMKIDPYSNFQPDSIGVVNNPHHFFRVATADMFGNLWIGSTFNGIFNINRDESTVENYFYADKETNSLRFDEFFFSMFTDSRGRVWYGTNYFGFFNNATRRFVNFKYPEVLSESPVKLKKITAFAETKNNDIWLGTENAGIGVISVDGDSATFVRSYTRGDGLPSNQIYEMATDKSNNVWVITPEGLSRIITSSGAIENYNMQYGVQGLNFISPLENGKMFIGTGNGYYLFDPDEIAPCKNKAKLYVKSFRIFDEEIGIDPLSINNAQVKLNYDQNFFSIEFGMVNFFKDRPVSFNYILEGLDEKWQHAGNRLVIGLVISTHFFRLQQLKKQEKLKADFNKKISRLEMKALRAQMNPHFLFNSLNSIRYYILNEDNDSAAEYITKFSKLLRLILNNSRQNQISLHDEMYALEIYIDFERMRFNNKFDYEINIEKGFDTKTVQIQPLTIQPFVENAIWHGLMPKKEKGKLKINVSKSENIIRIVIEDNGIGRQKGKEIAESGLEETKSFGLKITEDRMNLMESIRGKKSGFKVVDLFDNKKATGTKIIITFEV